jgi:hypothetical protein
MNDKGEMYEGEKRDPKDVPVDQVSWPELKKMPRRCRLAYYSEKRRGADEEKAMKAARTRLFR